MISTDSPDPLASLLSVHGIPDDYAKSIVDHLSEAVQQQKYGYWENSLHVLRKVAETAARVVLWVVGNEYQPLQSWTRNLEKQASKVASGQEWKIINEIITDLIRKGHEFSHPGYSRGHQFEAEAAIASTKIMLSQLCQRIDIDPATALGAI